MKFVLEDSFVKIIKSYGIEILNNYDFCRAVLKDMANGDYIDEITMISILLKNNIQKKIRKKEIFKVKKEVLVAKLSQDFEKINNYNIDAKLMIALIISAIDKAGEKDKPEGGIRKWTANFFKYLEK
jgi:hypothetical protein